MISNGIKQGSCTASSYQEVYTQPNKSEGYKHQAIRIFSIAFGVISFLRLAKNRSLITGLPLISLSTSLSAVGVYYPDFILNKISSLFSSGNK